MKRDEIRDLLWHVVTDAARNGPAWAQEGVVLRTISERVAQHGKADLATQQAILEMWHDLFAEKKLAWGYNLENPGSPFFHLRQAA